MHFNPKSKLVFSGTNRLRLGLNRNITDRAYEIILLHHSTFAFDIKYIAIV